MNPELLYQKAPAWVQTAMLNMHALRISRHRYGRRLRRATTRLQASETWSAEQLRQIQTELVRRIVAAAYDHSPYYRQLFRSIGSTPSDITTLDHLAGLPFLTKEIVREEGSRLYTSLKPARGWLHGHTSGTTGSPLSLWYDRNTCVMNNAVDLRQKRWAGMSGGDWIGLFLGRVVAPPTQPQTAAWRTNYVHRQVWFSSFHLNHDHLAGYIHEIQRRGLQYLEGYPSTLYILASYVLEQGIRLPMKAVFSSSETLHSIQREAIEQAFACRSFDFYGHAERAIFATECSYHEGKHLAEEYGYAEIVDTNGNPVENGQPGYLVGTSLHNTAMPMIRYRTGDISSIMVAPCKCGRSLRRIVDVSTKAEDIVVTPDGRMISPSILTHPFKPFDQIRLSQIVQDRVDRLIVKIVPSQEFSSEHQLELTAQLKKRLGQDMHVEITLVDDIPREPSGKYRWVISNIDHSRRFKW